MFICKMTPIINFIYKYTMLSTASIYFYSRIFDKNVLYDWYKPSFIFWMSITNMYLLELFRKDIKNLNIQ